MSGRRANNKLTDRAIKAFVRRSSSSSLSHGRAKLFDGGGLFLTVTAAGSPTWRLKFRVARKERLYAIGPYPQVTLEQARAEAEWARGHLKEGRDPVMVRRVQRADATTASAETFEGFAHDWLERQRGQWSKVHYVKSKRALERDVLPKLGKLAIQDISPKMVAAVIEAVARRGARDTAAKVLWHCSGVFRLAQARGAISSNPADPAREVLVRKRPTRRTPAVLTFPGLGEILHKSDAAGLLEQTRRAHRLMAFTASRISNVVEARWREFDLTATPALWVIPRPQMKAKDRDHNHKVFLCREIADEIREWKSTKGKSEYLFPSPVTERGITRETLEEALRDRLGLRDIHKPHGWRSALSTLARDNGFERDVVELALDHIHDNAVVRAYDRGERLQQRIKLSEWWGRELSLAQKGASVSVLKSIQVA